jgi:hypothetical protein
VPSLMHRRRALKPLITYIGLDVHKETIAVALAEAGNGMKCVSMAKSRTRRLP